MTDVTSPAQPPEDGPAALEPSGDGTFVLDLAHLEQGISIQVVHGSQTWHVTLKEIPEPEHQAPAMTLAPALRGEAHVGSAIEVLPGTWSGMPEPTLTFAWLRDGAPIAGATTERYVPVDADDRASLACRVTAHNIAGSKEATSESIRVLYRPPAATTAVIEEVFDQEPGHQIIEASAFFTGEKLRYGVEGPAVVDASTGLVSISTEEVVSGQEITVTAENSGGRATLLVRLTIEASEASPEEPDAGAQLSFASPSLVQIVVEEGSLTEYERVPAVGEKVLARPLDLASQVAGAGTLDGTAGSFSGERHASAPQLFEQWPEPGANEWSPAFAISDAATKLCPADSPAGWSVTVNGKPREVTSAHRKTVPIKTCVTGVDQARRSVRRHTVSLTLSPPLAAMDVVSVSPPSDVPQLDAIYNGRAVSEAIHICHEGYPVTGPKKAYLGLWLGHDARGAGATTNPYLSDRTRWQLVRVADGAAVESGTLALCKAENSPHQNNLNYNGCDIYKADFSRCAEAGTFRLEVDGVGASVDFPIAADPYAEALRLAARAYFYQRSGCAIEEPHGEGITRPRNGHPEDGLTVWQSTVKLGRTHEGFGSADPFGPLRRTPTGEAAGGLGAEQFPADPSRAIAWQGSAIQVSGSTLTWPNNDWAEISINLNVNVVPGKTYRVVIDAVRPSAQGTLMWKFDAGWPEGSGVTRSLADGENVFTLDTGGNEFMRATLVGQRPWNGENVQIRSISVREVLADGAAGGTPNPNAWGGWHDAGDWDRRIQHMDTVYYMAQLIETCPAVRTLGLNLPESGKPFADVAVHARKTDEDRGDGTTILPDLIHEALWGISLWRRTQRADGAILGGVEYSREAIEGSVSWNPLQEAYAYGYEEWAAYKFAMGAAKLGHVIKTVCGDRVLGEALIKEAVAAWTWAEGVLATGIDSANGTGGDSFSASEVIRLDRLRAAPVVYRAAGTEAARLVWESYNSFASQAKTGLPKAGTWIGWHPYDYTFQGLDYQKAGLEGRPVTRALSDAILAWASDLRQVVGEPMGTDYGLHSNGMYSFGSGWFRFGPGSNWMAARYAVAAIAQGTITQEMRDAVVQGLWFALGSNPSNVSLIRGLGRRQFGQHLLVDFPYPGAIAAGPAAGELRAWERAFIGDSLYPKNDTDWPHYARIFESEGAVLSSEFGVHANMMEWLFACAMAAEAGRA